MSRHRFAVLLPVVAVMVASGLWLSAKAQYRAYLCAPRTCPPNEWIGWADYTPPSIQVAGMLNMPVAAFTHPLYRLVDAPVAPSEWIALLLGVTILWSYIGWRIDTPPRVGGSKTWLRVLVVSLGCLFAIFILIQAVTMFHVGFLYKFVAISWAFLMLQHFIRLLRTTPAEVETKELLTARHWPRITLTSLVASWVVFLITGALFLSPRGASGEPNPLSAHVFAVIGGLLILVTAYAAVAHLVSAWRTARAAPDRNSQVIRTGLETVFTVAAVGAMFYVMVRA